MTYYSQAQNEPEPKPVVYPSIDWYKRLVSYKARDKICNNTKDTTEENNNSFKKWSHGKKWARKII